MRNGVGIGSTGQQVFHNIQMPTEAGGAEGGEINIATDFVER